MSKAVRVLIVEDDPTLREVLEEILTARGLDVVATSRGEEAIMKARQESFDLIVADIRMDGLSGLDAIEQAKELQPGIGSIVVSGFASEEETLRAVRLNVAGYLKKPFRTSELVELINNFLTQRAERLRQSRDLNAARDAFLWGLDQMGELGEKHSPGRISRAGLLAQDLARRVGFDDDLSRQLSLGALLRGLIEHQSVTVPDEVKAALDPYPLLLGALQDESSAEIATFAHSLCSSLDPDSTEWPAPDQLTIPVSPRVLAAYAAMQSKEGRQDSTQDEPPASPTGLLGLARTLEETGDFSGAELAYNDVLAAGKISQEALQAHLGKARLALAQSDTRGLERAVSGMLGLAEQMGPVAFALTELEAAEMLRRAGHPSTRKLLERAVKSLAAVNLRFPWARAVLALQGQGGVEPGLLADGLQRLASPQHLLEVTEQAGTILPDLLQLEPSTLPPEAGPLTTRLIRDHSAELARQVRRGSLGKTAKTRLLQDLESDTALAVAGELLEALSSESDPDLRARALALGQRQGGTPSHPLLKVYALGTLETTAGERRLLDKDWKTQKTKFLFARMVDAAPRSLSVERIMEDFWPGTDESARNNLNSAVSLIRNLLKGPAKGSDPADETSRTGSAGSRLDPVLRTSSSLGLNPDLPLWHDTHEVETACQQARRQSEAGNLELATSYLERVARLYRGPYMDGCYMDWVLERRAQLESQVGSGLEQLVGYRLTAYRYNEALEFALRLLQLQPDSTAGHESVMKAYLGLAQHDKAVAHFDIYSSKLRQDGLEPTMELLKVYQMARYGIQEQPGFTGV